MSVVRNEVQMCIAVCILGEKIPAVRINPLIGKLILVHSFIGCRLFDEIIMKRKYVSYFQGQFAILKVS